MAAPRQPSLDEIAAGEIDDLDVHNLTKLADLYSTLDPVPDGLVDRICFGITLDALHSELAELERWGSMAGARSEDSAQTHTVTFKSSTLTTMVTITVLSAELVRVDGWVVPGDGVEVELRSSSGDHTTTADANGRFVFDDVQRGPAQFMLRVPDSSRQPVVTPSITI